MHQKIYVMINDALARVLQHVSAKNPPQAKPCHGAIFYNTAGQSSTAVCIYNAGLCAMLPGCVERYSWN